MILTLEQVLNELKWLSESEENMPAIEKRYGSLDNSRKARRRMTDFIDSHGYCYSCYEKKRGAIDFDENNLGLCHSCYMDWENEYLSDGR
ncbi:hypothetical protein [Enterococcus hulanensis]|uniref:hypothetical protein n=1 Tax=Enterococcus hulanensis TaxID=2559929 RepID=UPI0010F4D036|nr:hypothetical protein [Enterococcus hulanensis]